MARLLAQAETYNLVFDRVIAVSGTSHMGAIEDAVPEWWGIVEAASKDGQAHLMIRG